MQKVILSIILLIFMLSSCQKEDLPTPTVKPEQCIDTVTTLVYNGERFGAYKVDFLTSSSEDNVLNSQGGPRIRTVYNQAKYKYRKYLPTGEQPFSQNGIFHWPYYRQTIFINDSIGYDTVSVGYTNGNEFTHFPFTQNNLLSNQHPAYKITFVMNEPKRTINVFRDAKINLSLCSVYYDNNINATLVDFLYPRDRTTNVFNPGDRY